jgi:hypothetical protein
MAGAASACFAAGVAVGLAAPVVVRAFETPPEDGDEGYVQRLAREYGLRPSQVRLARAVMAEKRERLEELMRSNMDKLPPELRSQRDTILRWSAAMVEGLLDHEQRARYQQDSARQPNENR